MTTSSRNLIHEPLTDLESHPEISCAVLSAEDSQNYVLREEEQNVLSGNETERRRAEFISGRAAAFRAILKLGLSSPGPVPRGPLGEPIWPEGIVGSITHSYPWTIAAVARSSDVAALGIDLESVSQLRKQDISDEICTPAELRWIEGQLDASVALGKIFSGKEALYKALSPQSGRRFDFKDVELYWVPGKNCFSAELLIDLGRHCGRCTEVHIRASGDWIFAHIIEVAR